MLESHGAMCRTVLLLLLVYQFSKGMEQPQAPQGPEQQFNQLLQNQGLGYLVAANADPAQLEARGCIKECHQSFGFVYVRQRNNWIPVATGTVLIWGLFFENECVCELTGNFKSLLGTRSRIAYYNAIFKTSAWGFKRLVRVNFEWRPFDDGLLFCLWRSAPHRGQSQMGG